MANKVDPDETSCYEPSHLDLHYLHRYMFWSVGLKEFRGMGTLSGPTSVAQLDARQTGDQEVAGSTRAGSATFFHGDLITKYFLLSFSPFHWFKKGTFSVERMCTILVNLLEDLSCPVKVWLGKLTFHQLFWELWLFSHSSCSGLFFIQNYTYFSHVSCYGYT